MQEKRGYHRLNINVPMRYVVPPQFKEISTVTADVSGTGLSFNTQQELKIRQELLMYLSLDDQKPVEMHAKVVRIEMGSDPKMPGFHVGVRIADTMKFDERKYVKFYAGQLNGLGKD